jgi:hypothetical protein
MSARIETSSTNTGSSSTTKAGSVNSARAMAMRWRCPPDTGEHPMQPDNDWYPDDEPYHGQTGERLTI